MPVRFQVSGILQIYPKFCCLVENTDIQREEEKVKRSVKDAAKKGQKDVCVVLAKEMIRSRKAVSKLYASRAHMNSVLMGMKNQLGKMPSPVVYRLLPRLLFVPHFLN